MSRKFISRINTYNYNERVTMNDLTESGALPARFWHEEGGASATEAALWLATIAIGLAVGGFIFL
jgi:hypothetical protein